MRLFAVLVAICTLSQTASAQTSECKSISDAGARLACYDKAASPPRTSAAARPQRNAVSKVDTAKYLDSISDEDARVDTQLKNICRGC
jgi:hypothetical protein